MITLFPLMEEESELQKAYDDVLRKTGRNLLMFQQAEFLLKRLIEIGCTSVTTDGPARSFVERTEAIKKQTLGQVTNLFYENHCTEKDPFSDDSSDPPVASMSFSFTLPDQGGEPEARKNAFAVMVAERNDLVHHLLPRLDRNSLESCLNVGKYLDEQRAKIHPEIKRLQQDAEFIQANMESLLAFLRTKEGMAMLNYPSIQQSPLVQQLASIASDNTDADEWIPLSAAAKRIQNFPPKKIAEHVKEFGMESLTGILVASQLFEIKLEPTESGGKRVLYRSNRNASSVLPS